MKRLILLVFLSLTLNGFSQLSDTLEAKKFWADNVHNLVTLNKTKILEQTHFPVRVAGKSLTKEQFKAVLDKTFNQELGKELGSYTFEAIDAWEMYGDTGQTYMIACDEGVGEYEAVVLCFLQYDGKWMLNNLDYQEE